MRVVTLKMRGGGGGKRVIKYHTMTCKMRRGVCGK